MKLIVDIPEEKLNIIKNKIYCGIYDPDLYKAIANGITLDEVITDRIEYGMTREKAKEILSRPFNMKNVPQDILEAHKIAIKALEHPEQNVVAVVPCGDAISRQAVLETLDNMDNVLDEDRTIENYKELLKECYEVLPSVNPQPKIGHWIDCSNGWMCSECHRDNTYDTDFCPNCDAKMIEL